VSTAREAVARALLLYGDPSLRASAEMLADKAIAAHLEWLAAHGYEVILLPRAQPGWWDTYEDEGDPPDHRSFNDQSFDHFVTVWNDHPTEVQVSYRGEPMEPMSPTAARDLAAALLAAAKEVEQ
jgi:hypothetical protein